MRWIAVAATVVVASLSAVPPSSAQTVPTSTTTTPAATVQPPPLVRRHFPAPPLAVGCYRFSAATTNIDAWRRVACATPAYIKKHFPHLEVLSGVSGTTGVKNGVSQTAAPFALSVLSAHPVDGQFGTETDSQNGSGDFSLQDNVFFEGSNGVKDAVQFSDQSFPSFFGTGYYNGVCVWQVDIPTQNYTSNCEAVLYGLHVIMVEGTVEDGLLTVGAEAQACCRAVAVIVPDMYGLGVGDRWNNSSGSILGYGKGSEAVFTNTEEAIDIQVSSCLDDAGFIGFSVFCSGTLKPNVAVSYSPGPSTGLSSTEETNNLVPVIGNPPGVLPTPVDYSYGGATARIYYVATTTGHCWTGTAPFCT